MRTAQVLVLQSVSVQAGKAVCQPRYCQILASISLCRPFVAVLYLAFGNDRKFAQSHGLGATASNATLRQVSGCSFSP